MASIHLLFEFIQRLRQHTLVDIDPGPKPKGEAGSRAPPPLRTINCHFVGKFDLINSRLNNKLMFFKQ